MKASIGRTVIIKGVPSNGSDEQAAVITRAWFTHDTGVAPGCVNLTVFPDNATPFARSSVTLYDTRAAAEAYLDSQPVDYKPVAAFWPDRV